MTTTFAPESLPRVKDEDGHTYPEVSWKPRSRTRRSPISAKDRTVTELMDWGLDGRVAESLIAEILHGSFRNLQFKPSNK